VLDCFLATENDKLEILKDEDLSGAVHIRVEVHRMDLELSGLVE